MRLYLINPSNPIASVHKRSWAARYAVWKPLGLLIVAALTPPDWDITVIDENREMPDYATLPTPDLVGITAFTSQANRAYALARAFRRSGIPTVMGGIHATMRTEEALEHFDAVVTGEAESIWGQVLEDASKHTLRRTYAGEHLDMVHSPIARHDLLPKGYLVGSIQTTRGCPLDCNFCSVTAFNGGRFRHRPIDHVVQELALIREKYVLFVDDNLVGTRTDHLARTKDLFRAIIGAGIRKKWVAQVTVNMGDDEELLALASQAGCYGVFIGFESPTANGLAELHKQFNLRHHRDLKASVRKIQRHGIQVLGAFMVGLDVDEPGIGQRIADTGLEYGLDVLNITLLTPLPGTRLWDSMEKDGRIIANDFPEDWKYYTLSLPVSRYRNLSWGQILDERETCLRVFYSMPQVTLRALRNLWRTRSPSKALIGLVSNLYQGGQSADFFRKRAQELDLSRGIPLVQSSTVPDSTS